MGKKAKILAEVKYDPKKCVKAKDWKEEFRDWEKSSIELAIEREKKQEGSK